MNVVDRETVGLWMADQIASKMDVLRVGSSPTDEAGARACIALMIGFLEENEIDLSQILVRRLQQGKGFLGLPFNELKS